MPVNTRFGHRAVKNAREMMHLPFVRLPCRCVRRDAGRRTDVGKRASDRQY
jgi:hypothetical protein